MLRPTRLGRGGRGCQKDSGWADGLKRRAVQGALSAAHMPALRKSIAVIRELGGCLLVRRATRHEIIAADCRIFLMGASSLRS